MTDKAIDLRAVPIHDLLAELRTRLPEQNMALLRSAVDDLEEQISYWRDNVDDNTDDGHTSYDQAMLGMRREILKIRKLTRELYDHANQKHLFPPLTKKKK